MSPVRRGVARVLTEGSVRGPVKKTGFKVGNKGDGGPRTKHGGQVQVHTVRFGPLTLPARDRDPFTQSSDGSEGEA